MPTEPPCDCAVTLTYSLLEPDVVALKYYACVIGCFLEAKSDEGTAYCN